MLSQVGSRWPVIVNTGNHERKDIQDVVLLNNTFQTYNNVHNLYATLDLGSFFLLMYDPYFILY